MTPEETNADDGDTNDEQEAGAENGKTRVCRNPGCSESASDEFDGCCSMVCSLENAAIGASVQDPRRGAEAGR